MDRFEIHTNFTGTVKKVYAFDLGALADPANLDVLRKLFTQPEALRPDQTAVGITEAASALFGQLADGLRGRGIPAADAAHFVMKLIFCLFAEDIGLLPNRLFTTLVGKCKDDPKRLARLLKDLFEAMSTGGDFGADTIDYFNGGLFADAAAVELRRDEIERVIELSRYDWSQVEPSIFGTLFERTLDPDKRAQIGAHYTSKQDILMLVEPVLMAPLRREWATIRGQCDALWSDIQAGRDAGSRIPSRPDGPRDSDPGGTGKDSRGSACEKGFSHEPSPASSKGEGDCRPEACATLRDRIAAAARKLNELRENWLNPKNPDGSPAMTETQLKKRTLTNLYNDRPTWLELAHLELDRAVLAAYGWPEEWAERLQPKRDARGKVNPILGVADPATEQEVLARLLALNLATSEAEKKR